jgi:hypothetical protein
VVLDGSTAPMKSRHNTIAGTVSVEKSYLNVYKGNNTAIIKAVRLDKR